MSMLSLLGMLGCGAPVDPASSSDPATSGKEDVGPNDVFVDAKPGQFFVGRIVYGATLPTDKLRLQRNGSLCKNDGRVFVTFRPAYMVRTSAANLCRDRTRLHFGG
jgi:hypothetical protein